MEFEYLRNIYSDPIKVRPDEDSEKALWDLVAMLREWHAGAESRSFFARSAHHAYTMVPFMLSTGPRAVEAVMRRHESQFQQIGDELQRAREEVLHTIGNLGVAPELGEALMKYVDLKISTDLTVSGIVTNEAKALYARRDPAKPLTAAELGAVLGVSDETVRNREQAGELFSVLRPGRKRGREYPAFQGWEGIAGEPLKQVLVALERPSGPVAYAFFTTPFDGLGGLTPVQALVGYAAPDADEEVREFAALAASERLVTVIRAARAFAASVAA
jgi:hypothetical protein